MVKVLAYQANKQGSQEEVSENSRMRQIPRLSVFCRSTQGGNEDEVVESPGGHYYCSDSKPYSSSDCWSVMNKPAPAWASAVCKVYSTSAGSLSRARTRSNITTATVIAVKALRFQINHDQRLSQRNQTT